MTWEEYWWVTELDIYAFISLVENVLLLLCGTFSANKAMLCLYGAQRS